MHKQVLLFITFLLGIQMNAQNRKEQLAAFSYKLDSLNKVILIQNKKMDSLDKLLLTTTTEKNEFEVQTILLSDSLNLLMTEFNKLQKQYLLINDLKQKNEIELLRVQSKFNSFKDSITNTRVSTKPIAQNQNAKLPEDIKSKTNLGVVQIGSLYWTNSNLDVTMFKNGDPLIYAKSQEEWDDACDKHMPAYCYPNYNPKSPSIYGKIYNYFAVNDPRGLAPEGFHIPNRSEVDYLEKMVGDNPENYKSTSGWEIAKFNKLCPNCKDWNQEYRKKVPCSRCKDTRYVPAPEESYSTNGNNSTGFNAIPIGFINGGQTDFGRQAVFWYKEDNQLYLFGSFSFPYKLVFEIYNFALSADSDFGYPLRFVKD